MNTKSILKVILIVVVFGAIGGTTSYFLSSSGNKGEPVAIAPDKYFGWKFPVTKFPSTGSDGGLAYSDIRDPGGIPEGLPVRLKIPIIGVNSIIEDALITPDGRMDVPLGSKNVAWFSLGPHPGGKGSAVIGGHFGISDGVKFVFYDLDKLRVNDRVYIEDDKGSTLTFIIRRIELFGRDDDATTVFTSNDGAAHLNLITCEGVWNRINDSYPERRVVFTDFLPGETANAKLISEIVVEDGKPMLPITAISPSDVTKGRVFSQTIIESVKSSFKTPADWLVTLILLVAIIFMSLKIKRG